MWPRLQNYEHCSGLLLWRGKCTIYCFVHSSSFTYIMWCGSDEKRYRTQAVKMSFFHRVAALSLRPCLHCRSECSVLTFCSYPKFFLWAFTLSLKCDPHQAPVWTVYSSEATDLFRRKADVTRSTLLLQKSIWMLHAACVILKLCDQSRLNYCLTSLFSPVFIFNLTSWWLLRCSAIFVKWEQRADGRNSSIDPITLVLIRSEDNFSIICSTSCSVIQDMEIKIRYVSDSAPHVKNTWVWFF